MDHGCDIICTTLLTLLGTPIIGGGMGLLQYTVLVVSSQFLQFLYTVSTGNPYTARTVFSVLHFCLILPLLRHYARCSSKEASTLRTELAPPKHDPLPFL